MSAIFKENKIFFFCCLLFLLIGAIALFNYPQGSVLLYFSENRQPIIDLFFKYATRIGEEHTYFLLAIISLFIRYRYALLIPFVGVIVTITSFLTKGFFQHPRPSVYYEKLGQLEAITTLEGVYLLGGLTSFPSGHTMSAFALFSFLALLFPKKKFWGLLFFLLALSVGISRIYLVQHFLKDVYLGAIIGVAIGIILYNWQATFPIEEAKWWNKQVKR